MKSLLVVTTLYPNSVQFRHGIFVETRLRRLLAGGRFRAVVVAPVPWVPAIGRRLPGYGDYARVPRHEERHGITVHHPRYLVIPKVGMLLTPWFLAFAMWRQVRRLQREGQSFDVVDAHYYYPDGVAAALLTRWLRLPLFITARGSDINLIAGMRLPGALIRWAARRARGNIAVSGALRDSMRALGVCEGEVHVLRNGVDLQRFRPPAGPRERASGSCRLLSVGNLIELKGHDLVIRALAALPDCELQVVGDGPLRGSLQRLAGELGVAGRVSFLGAVEQGELVDLYGAADILVLASSREGMPNVVLEAMACDTPVVATAVGGVPELLTAADAGVMVERRDAEGIAAGIRALIAQYPAPGATRRHAEAFSWEQTVGSLERLLNGVGSTKTAA